jgi:hypothetical protein
MSKSTAPRTDANKHSIDHLERYGFENSLDDRIVEWPILCEEIELELTELREHVGLCHDAIGECRGSDTSELHKFFDGHMKLMRRLHTAETQRDMLAEALKGMLNVTDGQAIYYFMEPQRSAAREALAAVEGKRQ